MNYFRDDSFEEQDSYGITSFYGMHGDTDMKVKLDVSIIAPVNNLIGPHISFIGLPRRKAPDEKNTVSPD